MPTKCFLQLDPAGKEIQESSKPSFSNTRILIAGFLALTFLNILNSAYSTVLTLIKSELSINYTQIGLLTSWYFVGYALGQIPWGYAADKYGIRRIMTLSLFGLATSTVLFGLAVDYWQIIIARFFSGLLGAGLFVPAVKLTSLWFSQKERGKALGILTAGSSFGLVVASYAAPSLAVGFGWRGSLAVLGILGIVSSSLLLLNLRDRNLVTKLDSIRNLSKAVKCKNFAILGLIQFIYLGAYFSFTAWLPIFVSEEYGLNPLAAGTVFSLFNLAGLLSAPLGGLATDRKGEKTVLFLSFLSLALTIVLFVEVRTLLLLFICVFMLGWFTNFVRSPIFTIIPKLWGEDIAGRVSGIQNTFASLGALVLPFILGFIVDLTASYYLGWITLSSILMLGALLNLLVRS